MGLDMWIYSGKKPEEDKIPEKPHADELDRLRLNYYIKEDIEEDYCNRYREERLLIDEAFSNSSSIFFS